MGADAAGAAGGTAGSAGTGRTAGSGGTAGGSPDDVRRVLAERIATGHLRPGQRLGAERALAADLGVSRATLRQALAVLADGGVVRRVPGRGGGTFVSKDKIERDTSRVVGVPQLLRSQGVVAGTRVISAGLSAAEEPVARALGLRPGDLVVDLNRIRLADGSPIVVEHARFPADRFLGLLEMPLGGSVYELLEAHFGTRPAEAVEQIEVVTASPDEAQVLDVAAGSPLLAITRTTSDSDGAPIEFSQDLFRGDRIRIVVRTPGAAGVSRAGPDAQRLDTQRLDTQRLGGGRVIELRPAY